MEFRFSPQAEHQTVTYPLTDDSPSGIGNPPTTYDTFTELIQRRTEVDKDPTYHHYQLLDFDNDGQQELIWREGSWVGVFTMKDGQVKHLVSGLDVKLCEGNIIVATKSYLDGNKTYCFYKIEKGEAILVDYLRYDADRNPKNPWLVSSDATGQDVSLKEVSEKEAISVINSYKEVSFDMKSFDKFPAS